MGLEDYFRLGDSDPSSGTKNLYILIGCLLIIAVILLIVSGNPMALFPVEDLNSLEAVAFD